MSKWEKFKWIVEQIKQMKKKSAPFATLGTKLIIYSIPCFAVSGVLYVSFADEFLINELQITYGDASSILGSIILLIGLLMVSFEMYNYKKARKTGKIIIKGMKDGFKKFPIDLLSYEEKNNSRDTIDIGMLEDNDSFLDEQVQYYNAEKQIDLYNRFIFKDEVEQLYVCGISRIPFLVAYGYCLKGNVSLKYIEREHGTNKSFFLDDENKEVDIIKINEGIISSEDGNIGIAIGFTTKINKSQLPNKLKNHTLFIKASLQEDRLLIKNQDNLVEIVRKIQRLIDDLSGKQSCKKIHLFLSVQTSFAIELGRHFQEGIHKSWVIHNYSGKDSAYSWSIELNQDGIRRFVF